MEIVNRTIPRTNMNPEIVHICIVIAKSYIIYELSSRSCEMYYLSNGDKLAQTKAIPGSPKSSNNL